MLYHLINKIKNVFNGHLSIVSDNTFCYFWGVTNSLSCSSLHSLVQTNNGNYDNFHRFAFWNCYRNICL